MVRRRGVPGWLLVLAFVVMPLLEIYVIIQVGQVVGPWWTILLLVLASVLGAWLVRREGGRAWRALQQALREGRMPARELADGALILVGGTLMLTPGFLTDVAGVLLILPFTRPLARGLLTRVVAGRMVVMAPPGTTGGPGATQPGNAPRGQVIPGEVVDEP